MGASKSEARVQSIAMPADRVVGWRFIRPLEEALLTLRRQGQQHPNRTLFLDHVVVAHLLAFFNPAVTSLRKIEDVFENPSVRKHLGTPRLPKSTLADAQRLFDPQLLLPLIESLKERVSLTPHDPRLDEITRKILASDGSFFAVAPRIAWALYNQCTRANTDRPIRQGQVRGHFNFDILRGIPDHVTLTDGQASEAEQLRAALEPGCLYLMDRGFQQYQLLLDILEAGSDFVVRLRKTARLGEVETLPLTAADRMAGVLSDCRVRVGWRDSRSPFTATLRRVTIAQPNKPNEPLTLLTNRTDLPAEVIGLLYRHRWQIELFFRWLKCMAQFQHFFSESQTAMTLQMYVAMIATLLIAVETGSKPSSYDYSLMSLAVGGLAPMEEILATAARRRAERQRAAERAKVRAAAQKISG